MLDQLRTYLSRFVTLSGEDFERIGSMVEVRRFKAREQLTNIGEIENYLNFIMKGVIRKYFVKERDEIVTQLSKEGDMICASVSFFTRQPSFYIIEAIESCTVASISLDNLESLMKQSPGFEHMGRVVVIEWLMHKTRWENLRIRLSPKERFLQFVQDEPELVKRVPQKYLATFLSIKPETFSRYKNMIPESD